MRYLFLLLLSFNAFAGFVFVDDINNCDRVEYTDLGTCMEKEGGNCYLTPLEGKGECGIYDLVDNEDENGNVAGKKMVVDQDKLTQRQALRQQSAQYEAAISKALQAMNCGRRVMAVLLVRNSTKNLSKPQVAQMVAQYDQPKSLLETGSLDTAKDLINSLQVDGTLVTEADKVALASEIDKCKP